MSNQELLDIEQLRQLKARYFRFVDIQDWERLAALFTPDATMFFPESQPHPVAAAAGIAFIVSALEGATSIHHGHSQELALLSDKEARGIWAMQDRIFWPGSGKGPLKLNELHGHGHYHETYRKRDGRWMIESFRLSRLWSRTTAPPFQSA